MNHCNLKYILIYLLLSVSYPISSQTKIDSLKILLEESSDTLRINLLNELSEAYKRISPQKTIKFANEALNLSRQINNELLMARSLENIGDGELLLGNLDSSELYFKQSFTIYDKLQDFEGLSDIYLDLGNISFFNTVYDSAAFYYTKSIGFKIDLGEKEGLIGLYNNLGAVYRKTGEIEQAIEALENAIKISEKFELSEKKGSALINLSNIYFSQGELLKAMNLNFEALQIGEQTNDLYTISNSFTNLGDIYFFIENYEKALDYQKKSLKIDQELGDWEGIITAYNFIGCIYLEQNVLDSAEYYFNNSLLLHNKKKVKINFEKTTYNKGLVLKRKKNFKNALDYFNQSLKISLEINDITLIVNNRMSIGEIFLEKNNTDSANYQLKEAYKLTRKHPLKEEYKVYLLLSQLYQKKNEYKKSLNFHIQYTSLKDSVLNSKKSAIAKINASYNLKKHEEEIRTLSKISELQIEKIQKQKAFRNILISGLTIILILLILYILSFKNKIKATKILQKQNEKIRNQNLEIKQKKENLAKINNELEKLSMAASKTDNAILISNTNGEIEWVNEGFTRLYGYTYDELLTEKGKTYIETSSNPQIKDIFNKALIEKKSQIYESNLVTKEGKEYKIQTTLTTVLNKKNEIFKLIAIDSDITKLKEVEDELQKLLITKDKFFSIIAHDLKNPFNSLIGLSQLLVHGFDRMSPEKIKHFHKNLYQISKKGYELLINLLEWSRSQMGTIQYQPILLNIYGLTEETFSLYNSKALEKEITLTNSTIEDSLVLADKNMIKTILRNLISNALKFTERGGAIEILENNFKGFKEITVRDTGIGISPEDIKKLFKLDKNFTTSGTEDETGTGLGLILCKDFVEKHGGNIRIESKIGFGSKFIFTLPTNNNL